MKTKIIQVPEVVEQYTFPALYKNNNFGFIVMFTSKVVGTVVSSTINSNSSYPTGKYSNDWVSCEVTSSWTRLPAGTKIELEQTE